MERILKMDTDDVVEQLKDRIAFLLEKDAALISADQPLHELGLDSIAFVDLLVFIEKQFNLALASSGLAQEDFNSINILAQRIVQSTTS
jgi:acyl carrier protein